MGEDFVDLVLSDVHLGVDDNHTIFTIHKTQAPTLCVDKDGDLDPPRKVQKSEAKESKETNDAIFIAHKSATPLKDVGFQVWRGSLLLADYLVHNETSLMFNSAYGMEIGCGVGLCGLALSRVAKRVFLTDYSDALLENCEANIGSNKRSFQYKDCATIRRFDWFDKSSWPTSQLNNQNSKYKWSQDDLEEFKDLKVVIASDVIYEDDLTDALFDMLSVLLQGDKVLFMSLEKRLNFTVDELEVTAHAYDHFHSYLTIDDPNANWGEYEKLFNDSDNSINTTNSINSNEADDYTNTNTNTNTNNNNNNNNNSENNNDNSDNTNNTSDNDNRPARPIFHAQPIPIDFPQYFEYERVKELELWIIKLGHAP